MCIKKLRYITETYIQYIVQREKNVEIYLLALHHKFVLFLQSRNSFLYVQDNEIEGDILSWTTSGGYEFQSLVVSSMTSKVKEGYGC